MKTGTFPPRSFHSCVPPQFFLPRKFPPHAKYTVDANLFRLESPIITRAKRATNRNNVGGKVSHPRVKNPRGETSGEEKPGGNTGVERP